PGRDRASGTHRGAAVRPAPTGARPCIRHLPGARPVRPAPTPPPRSSQQMATVKPTPVLERPGPPVAPAAPARRSAAGSIDRRTHPMWFVVPAFAILLVFFFVPTLFNFVYAFTDWSGFKSQIAPVGLSNFHDLAADGTLLRALRITLVYAVLVAIFQNL